MSAASPIDPRRGASALSRRDLLRSGCQVLPDRPLPLVAADLEDQVREYLGSAQLSVHLVGRSYGIVPEGARESVVQLQHWGAQSITRE